MESIEPYGDKTTVYKKAVIKFGVENQIKKLQQELTELLLALSYREEGRHDHNTTEEFADVEIVMEQLRPFFNKRESVDYWKGLKIDRLIKLVG